MAGCPVMYVNVGENELFSWEKSYFCPIFWRKILFSSYFLGLQCPIFLFFCPVLLLDTLLMRPMMAKELKTVLYNYLLCRKPRHLGTFSPLADKAIRSVLALMCCIPQYTFSIAVLEVRKSLESIWSVMYFYEWNVWHSNKAHWQQDIYFWCNVYSFGERGFEFISTLNHEVSLYYFLHGK